VTILTIIGAVIGAVALGAFGAALCNALQEPGEPSCLSGIHLWTQSLCPAEGTCCGPEFCVTHGSQAT
jgi:hypothetical protein